jgi:peptidyl-prolyl cis-trans isomerase SurA
MRILAAVLAVVFLSACRSTSGPGSSATVSPDTWAVVNGKPVMRADVERAFRQAADPQQTLSEEETLAAKLGMLDDLILEEIIVARAQKDNLQVAEADVDKAYAQAKGNLTDEAFQQQLSARQLSPGDLRDTLRRQLLTQKVFERDITGRVQVTDAEVSQFFEANRQQFNLPEDAFHLAQIVVTPVRDQQVANRTGDDAATPAAANTKVAMIMQRLQQGATFADLARDYSEDPESAPRGGDLGLVPISRVRQAPPALRDATLNLETGRARVVNEGGALTIIYVVSKEKAGQRDLSTPGVKDQITKSLRSRREQLLRTAYLSTARSEADVVNHLARRVVDAQGKPPAVQ